MPVYALVVDKNGPKFKEANESGPDIADLSGRPDLRVVAPGWGYDYSSRPVDGSGADMTGLTFQISIFHGRTVVDKTGLTEKYDLKLEWQPDEYQGAMFQAIGDAGRFWSVAGGSPKTFVVRCVAGATRIEARIGEGIGGDVRDRTDREAVGKLARRSNRQAIRGSRHRNGGRSDCRRLSPPAWTQLYYRVQLGVNLIR
jgi:hypothetical protein